MRTFIRCFLIFWLGSFIGSVIERIWCFIRTKTIKIRQSLIYSPLIPIYGFATLFIVIIADIVGYNLWKVFLIGVLVSTTIEYLFSYFQEKIFHTKSWDYSEFKFNLNGRVNLVYSIGFGIISSLIVKPIKIFIVFLEENINYELLCFVVFILFVMFVLDVLISGLACYRQKQRRDGILAKNKLDLYLDTRYSDKRLYKIYNNSVYVK